jgi:hypothetical protein
MALLGFGQWDGVPNERFNDADSLRWMRRFDADSDWPRPGCVSAPMTSARMSLRQRRSH